MLPNIHSSSFFRIVTHLGNETTISWSWWHKNGITLFPSSLITLAWGAINNTVLTWINAFTISFCCHMHFSFVVNWRARRLLADLPYLVPLSQHLHVLIPCPWPGEKTALRGLQVKQTHGCVPCSCIRPSYRTPCPVYPLWSWEWSQRKQLYLLPNKLSTIFIW